MSASGRPQLPNQEADPQVVDETSSLPVEPPSSPWEDPPSSPVELDPPSSPVIPDPPSSPQLPASSPPHCSSPSSSSDDDSLPKKRRKYEFNDLKITYDPKFWPQDASDSDSNNHDEISLVATDTVTHNDESVVAGGEERIFLNRGATFDVQEVLSDLSDSSSGSEESVHQVLTDNHCSSEEEDDVSSTASNVSSQHSAGDDEEHVNDSEISDEEHVNDSETSDEDSDSSSSAAKIYTGSDLSISEGVLTLMDLFINNKLTKTAMGNITESLQKFLPKGNCMPKSKHELFKFITERAPPVPVTEHYYCEECLFYLGVKEIKCTLCGNGSKIFYQLCLESQIRNLFQYHNLAKIIDDYAEMRRGKQDEGYADVCDGLEYKRAHLPGKYNLTLLGHTDGIQISESSDVSLWPLEWAILEIPHYFRFKYLIVSGVWVGDSHPYMNSFLHPFVDEMKKIYANGIKWVHPKTKEEEITFVVAPVFCADGPVRADIQNILYHGGRHCCHVCEQKMVKLEAEPIPPGCNRPPPRRRVFQLQENPSRLRTAQRMEAQGQMTLDLQRVRRNVKPVKGVKGNSVVTDLPRCDRSTVVYPEYMHLLLGIIKLFIELWFEGDSNSPWSLKRHRDKINEFLKNIQVPDFITRTPRSIDCYSKWKANELRTFLLYLSLIILSECMSEVYIQHWMLLVGSLYLLLQESISECDVTKAEILIKMFLRDFSRLYTKKRFTYNLHELSHLGHVTRLWGPPYLNSAFWFESFNGTLSKSIHGTKEQGKELINTIQLITGVQMLKARSHCQENKSRNVIKFLNRVMEHKFSALEKQLLEAAKLVKPYYVFYRASHKGQVFTSSIYSRQQKRNNYTVCFRSMAGGTEAYGEIVSFVCSGYDNDEKKKKMAFVKKFAIEHMRTFIHKESQFIIPHIVPIKDTNDVILVPMENILFKVIRAGKFVCLRPNTIEVNL